MNIIHKEKINKGWSSDVKYCIKDDNNQKYLLRVSSIDQYDKKINEFNYMKKVNDLGVNMCTPIEFGICDEGVYSIQSWIDGFDAETIIPNLSIEEQYHYGVIAGQQLSKIHSIKAPEGTIDWEIKFNKKLDKKIKMYEECNIKHDKAHLFIEYINNNRHLLKDRPNTFQHGDYHIGNMMINKEKELIIIDFNRNDFGDPYEEFNRIVWSAQVSPYFASGIINGYFSNNIPDEFWKLLLLYISCNSISSIPWAIPFGEDEINVMINQINDILSWYNDLKVYIPSWYKK